MRQAFVQVALLAALACVDASEGTDWFTQVQPRSWVRRNPNRNTFQVPRLDVADPTPSQPMAPALTSEAPKPTVVCGMAVIPMDPQVDPGIFVSADRRRGTRDTVRAFEPRVCK